MKLKTQQGYALLTAVLVALVIMALSALMLTYVSYGQQLSHRLAGQVQAAERCNEVGERFCRELEHWGDELLGSCLEAGGSALDPACTAVSIACGEQLCTVTRSAGSRLQSITLLLCPCGADNSSHLHAEEEYHRLFLPVGASLSRAVEAAGLTELNGRCVVGWYPLGSPGTVCSTAQLPSVTGDADYGAVFAPPAAEAPLLPAEGNGTVPTQSGQTFDLLLGDGSRQTVACGQGQSLREALAKAGFLEPDRVRSLYEADPAGNCLLLQAACPGADGAVGFYSTLAEALASCPVGGTITLLGNASAVVEHAVTILLNGHTGELRAGENYCRTALYAGDALIGYRFQGLARTCVLQEAEGQAQLDVYEGTLEELLTFVNASPHSCWADESRTVQGIALLGDVQLEGAVSLPLSCGAETVLLVEGAVTLSMEGGGRLTKAGRQEPLLLVPESGSLTVLGGALDAAGGILLQNRGGETRLQTESHGALQISGGTVALSGRAVGSVLAWNTGFLRLEEAAELLGDVKLRGQSAAALSGSLRGSLQMADRAEAVGTGLRLSGTVTCAGQADFRAVHGSFAVDVQAYLNSGSRMIRHTEAGIGPGSYQVIAPSAFEELVGERAACQPPARYRPAEEVAAARAGAVYLLLGEGERTVLTKAAAESGWRWDGEPEAWIPAAEQTVPFGAPGVCREEPLPEQSPADGKEDRQRRTVHYENQQGALVSISPESWVPAQAQVVYAYCSGDSIRHFITKDGTREAEAYPVSPQAQGWAYVPDAGAQGTLFLFLFHSRERRWYRQEGGCSYRLVETPFQADGLDELYAGTDTDLRYTLELTEPPLQPGEAPRLLLQVELRFDERKQSWITETWHTLYP